jgi:hypothetical protein
MALECKKDDGNWVETHGVANCTVGEGGWMGEWAYSVDIGLDSLFR